MHQLECTTGSIYCARTEEDEQVWVSLNGDDWLPVTCEPEHGDYADVVMLFDHSEETRGGKKITTFPIVFARRWFRMRYQSEPTFWTVKV